MKDKKRILRDTTYYTASTYIAQAVGIVTAVLVRRQLGPVLMGVWELLKTILRYGEFSELGVSSVATRDIPFYRGRNDEEEATRLKDVCFTYTLGIAVIAALAITVWSFWHTPAQQELGIGLRILGVILILTSIYSFFINMMRAYGNFMVLSRIIAFNALLMLTLVYVFTSRFTIYGMYAAVIVTLIICCIYAYKKTGYSVRVSLDWHRIVYVVKTGIPVFLSGLGLMLLMSVDKLVIARLLGFEQLGYYSIASMFVMTVYTLPKSFGIVLFPHIQHEYGKSGSDQTISAYLKESTQLLSTLMPVAIGLAYFTIPAFVHYVLPKFQPGIGAFKILILGSFFLYVGYPSQIFLFTLNKQVRLAVLVGISAIFALCAGLVAAKHWGIEAVAVAFSIAYAIYFLLLYLDTAGRSLRMEGAMRLLVSVFGTFGYFLALIVLVEKVMADSSVINGAAVRLCLFCAGSVLFLFLFDRRFLRRSDFPTKRFSMEGGPNSRARK